MSRCLQFLTPVHRFSRERFLKRSAFSAALWLLFSPSNAAADISLSVSMHADSPQEEPCAQASIGPAPPGSTRGCTKAHRNDRAGGPAGRQPQSGLTRALAAQFAEKIRSLRDDLNAQAITFNGEKSLHSLLVAQQSNDTNTNRDVTASDALSHLGAYLRGGKAGVRTALDREAAYKARWAKRAEFERKILAACEDEPVCKTEAASRIAAVRDAALRCAGDEKCEDETWEAYSNQVASAPRSLQYDRSQAAYKTGAFYARSGKEEKDPWGNNVPQYYHDYFKLGYRNAVAEIIEGLAQNRHQSAMEFYQALADEFMNYRGEEYKRGTTHVHPENYDYGFTWNSLPSNIIKGLLESKFEAAFVRAKK